MHRRLTAFLVTLLFTFSLAAARAAHPDLGPWFYDATGLSESSIDGTTMKSPDFLPGKSRRSMHCGARGVPIGNGIWQLVQFDRAHGIGLAMASTDQCSVAVFKASAPAVNVSHADLSTFSTGRGIRIGSTYESVLAAYGGKPAKRGAHFVTAYASGVTDTTVGAPHKRVTLPETITLVFDNDRISAITVTVDESGLY